MKQKIMAFLNSILNGPTRLRYAGLFLLSLLLRLPVLFLVMANPARAVPPGDAPGYLQLAMNLIDHGVFSLGTSAPYLPDAFRTPGYPVFLALILQVAGSSVIAVVIAQSFLHIFTGLIIARLGEEAFGSVPAGMVGAVLWAMAPIPSIFSGILFSEILFTMFFILLLWLLAKSTELKVAAAGAVLGIGILIRPISILVWPALFPFFFLHSGWRKSLTRFVLFSLTLAAVVAPWIYRNTVEFGKSTLASVQGNNLLYYNAAGYIAIRDGLTLAQARQVADQEFREYLQEEQLQPVNPMDESDAMSAAAIRIMAADPVRSLLFNGWNSLNGFRPGASYFFMFLFPDTLAREDVAVGELSPAVSNLDRPEIFFTTALLSIAYGVLFLLSAAGWLRLLWTKSWKALALFGLPCGILLYTPGIASNARFRIPIEPVLCLLAAVALCELHPRIMSRLQKTARPGAKPQSV